MAKDLNPAAILKRRPLRAWDAAQLMMRHLIEERGPTRQGFLKPEDVRAIKDGLAGAEIPIYNRFMTLYEELDHNLLRGLGNISTFQVMTLQLEQLLNQFRTAADLTEDLGTELDELGEAGEKLKRALGYSLFWITPLAISWPAIKDKAEWTAIKTVEARFGGFFETARNADITAFADRFKRDNPYRVMAWQNVLAYGEIFKLAESVLGIDDWAKTFECVRAEFTKDKDRFEAKAIYLDCLLRQAVKRNTDPIDGPANRRLGEATLKAMSEEDRARLTEFYPILETEPQMIDEDLALTEACRLDDGFGPKVAELVAQKIEARLEEMALAREKWRAKVEAMGPAGAGFAKDLSTALAKGPKVIGWYATVDLSKVTAEWPDTETPAAKVLAWLQSDLSDGELVQPLGIQEPELVARWVAKREELRPTVSAEVIGPKAYDGFLRDSVLTDLKPMIGGGLDPQAYAEFMQHLESFRQYAPAN